MSWLGDNTENEYDNMATAPGFRFHPTDEELVSYYLKRKICAKPFRFDAISEIDVYKNEPWDLPGKSKLKSKDLEWYFFSGLDKKYGNGARTNRATEKGYWKTTGKDRTVSHKSHVVGMKKTLVYHSGRAPRGQRTNWVMHEYRLIDEKLAEAGICQLMDPLPPRFFWIEKDAFVLCRIFQKSGPGPMNGEKYGAPFVEEEWEKQELVLAPSTEVVEEVEGIDDHDFYLDSSDIEQIFGGEFPMGDVPYPLGSDYGDSSNQVQERQIKQSSCALEKEPGNQMQNQVDLKPANQELVGEPTTNLHDVDYLLDEPFCDPIVDGLCDPIVDGLFADVSFLESDDLLNDINVDLSERTANLNNLDFLPDEPFFDATADDPLADVTFLENDDLWDISNVDPSGNDMFGEYLNFYNKDQDTNFQPTAYDSSKIVAADQAFPPKLVSGGDEQEIMGSHHPLQGYNDHDAAFMSTHRPKKDNSGGQYSFVQKASKMLGGISAPPALASEFPSKESAFRLVSASGSSVHLTAGVIQIQKPRLNGTVTSWALGKNVDISFFLSFGLSHNNADSSLSFQSRVNGNPTNATSSVSRSMMYLMFLWVLILSVTYKIGSCFCSGNVSS